MWRVTIIANVLLMSLFWFSSIIAMSMAYNRLIQYVQDKVLDAVPLLTWTALSLRLWSVILPLAWIISAIVVWKKVKGKEASFRSEYLLAFTLITVITGFSMLTFFALAGILPFLLIHGVIN